MWDTYGAMWKHFTENTENSFLKIIQLIVSIHTTYYCCVEKELLDPHTKPPSQQPSCSDVSTDLEVEPLFGCHWEKVMFV